MYHEVKNKETGQWEFKGEAYGGRNYDAFAILADVRNGRGFAGVKTGEGFNPIADPKGVPSDASAEYKERVEDWKGDGHSHSYFTVAELKAYDWNQTTIKSGLVGLGVGSNSPFGKGFAEMHEEGKTDEVPSMYFGGGTGVQISKEDAIKLLDQMNGDHSKEALIKAIQEIDISFIEEGSIFRPSTNVPKDVFIKWLQEGNNRSLINVRLSWETAYKEAAGGFYESLLEETPSQYPDATDDEVRYVFFFDN